MQTLDELFTAMWLFKARGLDSWKWALMPKQSASHRVTRHFMKHQRQLQNAQRSGIGEQEVARRASQIRRGILQATAGASNA